MKLYDFVDYIFNLNCFIKHKLFVFTIFFLRFLIPCLVSSQVLPVDTNDTEIGIIEKLDTYVPTDISLISEKGDTVLTKNLLGKPSVLSLVYYRCPGICTPLMDGLAEVVKKSDLEIGKDYQILTVSFNPRESTELARRKKNNYINVMDLKEIENGWFFFTADSLNISRLTESVGFKYKRTGNDYIHSGTLIFLSSEGKITRYLNGIRFLPFEFKMAVIEASRGESGPTINKVLQYCYSYDPEGQQYALNITRVAGVIITFVLIIIFLTLVIRSAIKRRQKIIQT